MTRIEGSKLSDQDVEQMARGTVKDHVNQLLKNGYLVQHGKGKRTWK